MNFVLINFSLRKKITVSWDINSPNCVSNFGGYRKMLNEGWVDRRELKYKHPPLTKIQRFKMKKDAKRWYEHKLQWLTSKQKQIVAHYGDAIFKLWQERTLEQIRLIEYALTTIKNRNQIHIK